MYNDEFYKILNSIFNRYSDINNFNKILPFYDVKKIQELNNYVSRNYCKDICIKINGYEFVRDKIILKTELGSFLLDKPMMNEDLIMKRLFFLVNNRNNLLDFFGMLFKNDIFYTCSISDYDDKVVVDKIFNDKKIVVSKIVLKDYLMYYFIYRMLLDSNYERKLFRNCSVSFSNYCRQGRSYRAIPLECLNNVNFNYYAYTDEAYSKYLMNIFENYYCFDKNLYLLFSIIIVGNKYDKLSFIMDNIDLFKKFILEEVISSNFNGKQILAYSFLKDTNLISLFTEEELKNLYISEPIRSFKYLEDFMLPIAKEIKNTSPMIQLYRSSERKVHVEYHDYDLYDGVPVGKIKADSRDRCSNFLSCFIYNNEVVVKLYNMYYKGYKKIIKDDIMCDNLEDFMRFLFQPKNLFAIFSNHKFNWDDLKKISKFKNCYGEEVSSNIEQVTKILRNKSLNAYNQIVLAKDDLQKLDTCISKLGLSKNNFSSYIIQDKFLYSKEKSGLLKIAQEYYGDSLKVLDVLMLMDEMLTYEMTLDEILKERGILNKDFQKIYDQAMENNPILYQCIFESLNKNKRRGYLKLIRFGYKVLDTDLSSMEEYENEFGKVISFSRLLSSLKKTELYSKLLEKSSCWEDFDVCEVKNKRLEKKLSN